MIQSGLRKPARLPTPSEKWKSFQRSGYINTSDVRTSPCSSEVRHSLTIRRANRIAKLYRGWGKAYRGGEVSHFGRARWNSGYRRYPDPAWKYHATALPIGRGSTCPARCAESFAKRSFVRISALSGRMGTIAYSARIGARAGPLPPQPIGPSVWKGPVTRCSFRDIHRQENAIPPQLDPLGGVHDWSATIPMDLAYGPGLGWKSG